MVATIVVEDNVTAGAILVQNGVKLSDLGRRRKLLQLAGDEALNDERNLVLFRLTPIHQRYEELSVLIVHPSPELDFGFRLATNRSPPAGATNLDDVVSVTVRIAGGGAFCQLADSSVHLDIGSNFTIIGLPPNGQDIPYSEFEFSTDCHKALLGFRLVLGLRPTIHATIQSLTLRDQLAVELGLLGSEGGSATLLPTASGRGLIRPLLEVVEAVGLQDLLSLASTGH